MGYRKQKLADDGVWVDFFGAQLKIGRVGTPAFADISKAINKPFKRQLDNDTLPAAKARELNLRALARAILTDWDGIEDEAGKILEYSEDEAVKYLDEDAYMLQFVMETAQDNAVYVSEVEAKIVKKSTPNKAGS